MSLSTDVATLAAACRRCLANGTSFTGLEIRLCIDTLETLANTTEAKAVAAVGTANTDADALEVLLVTWAAAAVTENTKSDAVEALLVTHFGILEADGASPTQGHVDAMVAACATPRSDLIASTTAQLAAKVAADTPRVTAIASMNAAVVAAAASVTNITVNDSTDGRSA